MVSVLKNSSIVDVDRYWVNTNTKGMDSSILKSMNLLRKDVQHSLSKTEEYYSQHNNFELA